MMHHAVIASIIAASALAPAAHAQSLRCIEEHLISEASLDDRATSYAILENGTLAVLLTSPTQVIRFYDTTGDTLTLRSEYELGYADYRNTIHAHGNDLYTCLPQTDHPDSQNNIHIIDASDPSNPTLRTQIPVSRNLNLADFDGNTAFFTNDDFLGPGNAILHVYDITNPDEPILRRQVTMGINIPRAEGFQVAGGLMHISTYDRVNTYTINALGQTQWKHAYHYHVNSVWTMEAVGQTLYMGRNSDLEIYDFADPANPVLRSSTPNEDAINTIRIAADTAYVHGNEIRAYDISNPDAPTITGKFTDYMGINSVIPADDRLFIARDYGVTVFDASVKNYMGPNPTYTFTSGEPHEMIVQGDTAYIANGSYRLSIYDIADPMAPQFVTIAGSSSFPFADNYTQIAADADSIVTANDGEIIVFTNADPRNPTVVARFEDFVTIADIDISDNNLAVFGQVESATPGETESVLAIYNITNPANPTQLSVTQGFGDPQWVRLQGNTAVTYDSSFDFNDIYAGLRSFDISNPASPVYMKRISLTDGFSLGFSAPSPVVFSGDTAYIGNGEGRISILAFSGPNSFTLMGEAPTGFNPSSIDILGNLMIVEANGLYLYDISNPTTPVRVGMAHDLEFPTNFGLKPHIIDNTVLASHMDIGLVSYEINTCINCPADLNNDNQLDFYDVSAFLASYIAQSPASDFNNDGQHNFFDVSQFLIQFQAGCP